MGLIESIILVLIPLMKSYGTMVAFFGVGIGGEAAILVLAFLAASNVIPIYAVIIFGFLGTVTADCLWYFIARYKVFLKIKNWKSISKKYKLLEKKIEKISLKNDFFILLIAKFLIGTWIITILYLNAKDLSMKRFMKIAIPAGFVWAVVLFIIGFLAGKGFYTLLYLFKNLQIAVMFLVFFVILFYLLSSWITDKVKKL